MVPSMRIGQTVGGGPRVIRVLLILVAILSGMSAGVAAQERSENDSTGAYTIRFENDFLLGTDRGYTGGLMLGWSSKEYGNHGDVPLLGWIPIPGKSGRTSSSTLTLGQGVYTPDNLASPAPIEGDRPYAGLLHLTVGARFRTARQQQTFETTVGLVGPSSLAKSSQDLIHKLAPAREHQGWESQLRDEAIFQGTFEYDWKALVVGSREGFKLELIPHYKAGLGTLSTFLGLGGQVRAGWNLSDDFGMDLPKPGGLRTLTPSEGKGAGLEIYLAADRMRVIRNLLLDGNTFEVSHRVKREPFTSAFLVGLNLRLGRIHIGHEYVRWTKRYRTEAQGHAYSSFTLGIFH
jgi:hypothetical protein